MSFCISCGGKASALWCEIEWDIVVQWSAKHQLFRPQRNHILVCYVLPDKPPE